uniref:Glutamine--tRNA ligase n=1 Tax=Ananas comosus var. bracteatus TaxID=296719 RepID=A0A6V7QIX4_ANACO|nr:unnamed protein product [Ananas comosus var. bracteatus]
MNNPSGEYGNSALAFHYILLNSGITSWDGYPFPRLAIYHFTGYKDKCNRKLASHHFAHIDRYHSYFDIDEKSLEKIVDLQSVVAAVGVDKSWYKYDGGVFQGCPTERSNLNHEVLIIGDNSMIHIDRLEYYIREELNKTAPRTTVVLHPVKVVITNLDNESIINVDAKKWPAALSNDGSSYYKVPFTSILYIERSDFRKNDSKDYYGLAPGKSVLLRYAFPIKCTDVIYGDDENSGVLHWVAQPSPGVEPLKVEVRLFEKLFLSENPAELEDWLSDPNPNSKEVIHEAYAVLSLASAVLGDKYQFERLGYFAVDPDTNSEKPVFNRTVTLRDAYSKGGIK